MTSFEQINRKEIILPQTVNYSKKEEKQLEEEKKQSEEDKKKEKNKKAGGAPLGSKTLAKVGKDEAMDVVGSDAIAMMERLREDYTRENTPTKTWKSGFDEFSIDDPKVVIAAFKKLPCCSGGHEIQHQKLKICKKNENHFFCPVC